MSRKKGKQRAREAHGGSSPLESTVENMGTVQGEVEEVGEVEDKRRAQGGTSQKGGTYVPLTRTSTPSSVVSAALAQAGESMIGRQRGSLDRGTLAQCLNATSQIAAECNRILRELLRGCETTGYVVLMLRSSVFRVMVS